MIYSGGLQAGICRQHGGGVKEMEEYSELLMGAFLQSSAVFPASLSNRKLPPSFTVLLLANVHNFWPFRADIYVLR